MYRKYPGRPQGNAKPSRVTFTYIIIIQFYATLRLKHFRKVVSEDAPAV